MFKFDLKGSEIDRDVKGHDETDLNATILKDVDFVRHLHRRKDN